MVWQGRAQVGRPLRQTPSFRAEMTYLVFNPTWTVPPTILAQDYLPFLKQDPGYIQRKGLKVIDRAGRAVEPGQIDWSRYSASYSPYLLRQDPGPRNALGRVKFIFPNDHAVFLHDTPNQKLFDRTERAFSSGCIRVENALDLARLLLNDEFFQRVRVEFGDDAQPAFNLHPPLLRALGLNHKLRLGMWFVPVLKALRALRSLRGTPLNIFGYARVRRVERQLIGEYRQLIESLLADLDEVNYPIAVQIAELPDLIRGYEDIKLASVGEFRRRVEALLTQFRAADSPAVAV